MSEVTVCDICRKVIEPMDAQPISFFKRAKWVFSFSSGHKFDICSKCFARIGEEINAANEGKEDTE